MKKICVIVPRFDPIIGGTEFLCKQIIEGLDIEQYELSVITTPNKDRNKNNYNYKIFNCDFNNFSLMKEHFEIFKYDLCLFFADLHDNFLNSYDYRWNKHNICVLNLDERTYQARQNFNIALNNLKNFDLTVTFTKDGVANKYLHENNIKHIYVPNFSRDITNTKNVVDYIQKLGLNKSNKTILYNAAFEERKNQLFLIDYINNSKKLSSYNWIFMGAVADEQYLASCINKNKNKNVRFLNGTPKTEIVSQLYQQVDCVILLSIAEGLPLVLLEALSANKPFLATPTGGIKGVLGEKCPNYVLDTITPSLSEIENKIELVLSTNIDNRKIWLDNFNKDVIIKTYQTIIRDLLK